MIYLRKKIAKYNGHKPLRTAIKRVSKATIIKSIDEFHDSESDSEWLPFEEEQQILPKKRLLFGRSNSLFEIDYAHWSKQFYEAGLYDFLISNAGGSNSDNSAKVTCHRLSSYISWVVKFLGNTKINENASYFPTNPLFTTAELLVKNPRYLGKYMDYLGDQNASPSTKLTILGQLRKCALWSSLFSPVGTFSDQISFEQVCRNLYKACAKQNRIRIQDRGNLDNLVASMRWPVGGYAELRDHVLKGGCEFMDSLLLSVNNGLVLKSSEYCRLLRILITLMYLTSHQGRPNALRKLK